MRPTRRCRRRCRHCRTAATRPRSHSHSSSHHHGGDDDEEIFFEIPEFSLMAEVLLDESAPIAKRMRTAFLLKQVGDQASIDLLAKGLRSPSVLMAHECGYVLGQLQNKSAIPLLEEVLRDATVNPIVRHECAEALGAIGDASAIELLREFSTDECDEVRETCLIALEKLAWNAANPGVVYASKYASVDPAPRTDDASESVADLQRQLMDTSKSHFERYRAMFALRDRDSEEAVLALATGFEDKSAVFRHEVAYVMGQIQHPAAVESLKSVRAQTQCIFRFALRLRGAGQAHSAATASRCCLLRLTPLLLPPLRMCVLLLRRCCPTRASTRWFATKRPRLWAASPRRRSRPTCRATSRTTRTGSCARAAMWRSTSRIIGRTTRCARRSTLTSEAVNDCTDGALRASDACAGPLLLLLFLSFSHLHTSLNDSFQRLLIQVELALVALSLALQYVL